MATLGIRADKRETHIVPASFLRDSCHYRAFGFRAFKAARMIRCTLARFSGRCVQCNLLRGCLPDRRLSSLRSSRAPMTLSIACLSVRSSARMLNSFNVFLSSLKRNGGRLFVQQHPAEYVALEQREANPMVEGLGEWRTGEFTGICG